MDYTNNSLDWSRLLKKSSEEECDSDETYCEEVENEPLETSNGNNITVNQSAGEDFEMGGPEILSGSIFTASDTYQSIDGTKSYYLSDNNDLTSGYWTKTDSETDKNESSDRFISYEEYLLSDPEEFIKGIPSEEVKPCVQPLTLNHQRKISPRIMRRKIKMYMEKKKLPDRKCASYYIEKSNRMLEEENRTSSDDSEAEKETLLEEFEKHLLKYPKQFAGRKRGRTWKRKNRETEQNVGQQGPISSYTKKKILQDLEADLRKVQMRLSQPVDTREQAFQILSQVQTITKTIRFHLDQTTRYNKKTEPHKSQRKFLLSYLAQQLTKAQELEKFLDNAISEADRLTRLMETSEDETGEELIYSLIDGNEANEEYTVCGKTGNIKTILKSSKSSTESTNNSSEPKHISFSDEVEYRYITQSTQNSDEGENQTEQISAKGIDELERIEQIYREVRKGVGVQKVSLVSGTKSQSIFPSEALVARPNVPINSHNNGNLQISTKKLSPSTNNILVTKNVQQKPVLNQALSKLLPRHNEQQKNRLESDNINKINTNQSNMTVNTSLQKPHEQQKNRLESDYINTNQSNVTVQCLNVNKKPKLIFHPSEKYLTKETFDHKANPARNKMQESINTQTKPPVQCLNVNDKTKLIFHTKDLSKESSVHKADLVSKKTQESMKAQNKLPDSNCSNKNSASSELFRFENSESSEPLSVETSEGFQFTDDCGSSETISKSNARSKLFRCENSESSEALSVETSEGFQFTDDCGSSETISKSNASSKLFRSENNENSSLLSIQIKEDLNTGKNVTVLKNNKPSSENSEILQSKNGKNLDPQHAPIRDGLGIMNDRKVSDQCIQTDFGQMSCENQTDSAGAFGFSELQSSLLRVVSKWTPCSIKDIKYVRVKDESEFINLDDLPKGAMDSPDWFDFTWTDQ